MGILKKAGQITGGIAGNVAGLPGMIGGAIAGGKAGEMIGNQIGDRDPEKIVLPSGMTAAEMAAARDADWKKGYARGQELFGEGSLGRLGKDADIQEVLKRRRAQVAGFTPQEMEMIRSNSGIANRSNLAGSLRNLQARQGAAGIRGAAAGAQAGDLMRGANLNAQENERQLQLANIAESRRGVDALEQTASGVGKYDIGQMNKEKFGQYSTGLGEQMLGAADRGAVGQREIAAANLAYQQQRGGKLGGKV